MGRGESPTHGLFHTKFPMMQRRTQVTYPSNVTTIPEVDPMVAKGVFDWAKQLVELPEQYKALQAQMKSLEDRIAEMGRNNNDLSAQVAKVAQENESLKSEMRYIVSQRDAARDEVRLLHTRVAERDRTISDHYKNIADLKDTLRNRDQRVNDLEIDGEVKDETIRIQADTIAKLQGKLDQMVKIARDTIEDLAGAKEAQPTSEVKVVQFTDPEPTQDRTTQQAPIGGPDYRPFAAVASGANPTTSGTPDGQRDPDLGRPDTDPRDPPSNKGYFERFPS